MEVRSKEMKTEMKVKSNTGTPGPKRLKKEYIMRSFPCKNLMKIWIFSAPFIDKSFRMNWIMQISTNTHTGNTLTVIDWKIKLN